MKKDIKNRADIELLVNTFYEKVKSDYYLNHIFTDIANVQWEKHLPVMYNFWENILFYTGNYEGNPMHIHQHLSKISTIQKKHFQRWNKLFIDTVDQLFNGTNAEFIKKRALSISKIIQKNILTTIK